jgi:hypothetical protein
VLIYVVSLVLYSPLSLNIHNQCKDIHLTSPVYFIHGGKRHILPDQEIVFNAVMQNRIEPDPGQDIPEGTLVYKIQRKQDESNRIWLLVAWGVEHTKELHVRAFLVEHDKEFNWDEDKLRQLYQKYWHPLNIHVRPIENNWLLNNKIILETKVKTMNDGYRRDISISEGTKYSVKRTLWIDAER